MEIASITLDAISFFNPFEIISDTVSTSIQLNISIHITTDIIKIKVENITKPVLSKIFIFFSFLIS